MGQGTGTHGTAVNEAPEPQQLRAEIEDTRKELGDTVAALVGKTDVKAQAKRKSQAAKASIAQKKRNPTLLAAALGALAVGAILGRAIKRRR